jgi:hypothetical protein
MFMGLNMVEVISNSTRDTLFTGEWEEVLVFLRERGFTVIAYRWLDWVVVE